MSLKCCSTAFAIGISSKCTLSSSARHCALLFVRAVVPKHGIDTVRMPVRGRPSISNAFAVTSNANVESRPPESPMTAVLQPMCFSLVARPVACILRIVSQRAERSASSFGTNGYGYAVRVVSNSGRSIEASMMSHTGSSCHVFMRRRSCTRRSTSMSP